MPANDKSRAADRTMKAWAYEEQSARRGGDVKRADEAHRNMQASAETGAKDRRDTPARKPDGHKPSSAGYSVKE